MCLASLVLGGHFVILRASLVVRDGHLVTAFQGAVNGVLRG